MPLSRPPAPLVIITGQTASGKSAIAMELAGALDGEILCADSRTIYRGLDIGAAKPGDTDRGAVPHHLLDLLDLDEFVGGADFSAIAQRTISDVRARGRVPVAAGGTRLFVHELAFHLHHLPVAGADRARLKRLTAAELRAELVRAGVSLPLDDRNPDRLRDAIELNRVSAPTRSARRANVIVLSTPLRCAADLLGRVRRRVADMLAAGLESEVRALARNFAGAPERINSIGYSEWQPQLHGTATLAQVADAIVRKTLWYAEQQRAWITQLAAVCPVGFVRTPNEAIARVSTAAAPDAA